MGWSWSAKSKISESAAESARRATDEILSKEYLYLTSVWDDFDKRALTIKGWSAAGAGAALLALAGKNELSSAISIAVILLLLSFWILEGFWKKFQHSNWERIEQLERHFAGKEKIKVPFQCHTNSRRVMDEWGWKRLLHEMKRPIVFLPYVPLLLAVGVTWISFQLETSTSASAKAPARDEGRRSDAGAAATVERRHASNNVAAVARRASEGRAKDASPAPLNRDGK